MKSLKASPMNLNNYFDLSRFWLLLKTELFKSRKGILMTIVITFGALFFLGLLLAIITERSTVTFEHYENYASSLLIGGFILSSLAFNDLSNVLKRYTYLTLPVSTLERFMCMWLLTSVGWIVLFTLTYTVYTWIANPVGHLIFNYVTFMEFKPFGEFPIKAMKSYFVLQGIFLVGAAHFRGYVFPKTLVILVFFGTLCGVITYFIMEDLFLSEHACSGYECQILNEMEVHQVWEVVQWVFWWLVAPLCWVVTYLGLKDQEV